jgi:hypothetical protein
LRRASGAASSSLTAKIATAGVNDPRRSRPLLVWGGLSLSGHTLPRPCGAPASRPPTLGLRTQASVRASYPGSFYTCQGRALPFAVPFVPPSIERFRPPSVERFELPSVLVRPSVLSLTHTPASVRASYPGSFTPASVSPHTGRARPLRGTLASRPHILGHLHLPASLRTQAAPHFDAARQREGLISWIIKTCQRLSAHRPCLTSTRHASVKASHPGSFTPASVSPHTAPHLYAHTGRAPPLRGTPA